MKNIALLIFAFSMISVSAFSQKSPPDNVKKAFTEKYATAQLVKWDSEEKNEWEAEFTMNNKDYSASFSPDGNWLETEYKISETEIPAVVTNTLGKKFPGHKIVTSEISETSKGKVYEFEINTGKAKKEVAINADGTLVKK